MKEYTTSDIDKIVFDESGILSIEWINEEIDLKFLIDWCGQEDLEENFDFNKITTNLYFEFVTNVEFNFKFKEENLKAIEITCFNHLLLPDGTYEIEFIFEFQPVGYIRFRCNDFKFVIEDNV
jgi:hypothetical protein